MAAQREADETPEGHDRSEYRVLYTYMAAAAVLAIVLIVCGLVAMATL